MRLVIFDIDGTLAHTTGVDDACFARAINDVFSIQLENTDWSVFPHVTDTGMAYEIYKKRFGVGPSKELLEQLRVRFVELIDEERSSKPGLFNEVKGASAMFSELCQRAGYAVGIATGGWRETASIKLDAIRIDHKSVPFYTTDDHYCRRNITELVIEDVKKRSGRDSFDDIVYVGDGAWDYKTTREMGIRFIGIDAKGNGKLKNMGAEHVLPDYVDRESFYRLIG